MSDPLGLRETPQRHLIVEHCLRLREGLQVETNDTKTEVANKKINCAGCEGFASWPTALTYQTLVDDAEHEHVVQKDVSWIFWTEAEVSDRCVSFQPQGVRPLFLQLSTPLCVFFV